LKSKDLILDTTAIDEGKESRETGSIKVKVETQVYYLVLSLNLNLSLNNLISFILGIVTN